MPSSRPPSRSGGSTPTPTARQASCMPERLSAAVSRPSSSAGTRGRRRRFLPGSGCRPEEVVEADWRRWVLGWVGGLGGLLAMMAWLRFQMIAFAMGENATAVEGGRPAGTLPRSRAARPGRGRLVPGSALGTAMADRHLGHGRQSPGGSYAVREAKAQARRRSARRGRGSPPPPARPHRARAGPGRLGRPRSAPARPPSARRLQRLCVGGRRGRHSGSPCTGGGEVAAGHRRRSLPGRGGRPPRPCSLKTAQSKTTQTPV